MQFREVRRPPPAAELLTCPAKPIIPPGVKTDVDLTEQLAIALEVGDACRENLARVRELVTAP